jgi:asparagine synthase (glutamine-hydrolysing)
VCGIAGFVHLDGTRADPAVARAMADAIRSRGPDDDGVFAEGPVALGFRRLSIIDLSGGHQPMSSADGRLWIVFNGEIYNFPELRRDLEGRGYPFRTHSDTETILYAYDAFGEAVPEKLNGMFAFALWDASRERLVLARDRMGKKPLYYAYEPGRFFAFASELKALLRFPRLTPSLDLAGMRRYLAFDYLPDPHTIYRGVHKLPPGNRLILERGSMRLRPYWDLTFTRNGTPPGEAEAAEELVTRMREAVRRRLLSDVPLGVFLSGGIDSSAVVALMAELRPGPEIKTFSVAFREKSFDESSYARAVAARFGTDHREELLEPQAMLDILPTVCAYLDEPFADASVIPTYLLSRFTRQHVTVALGGDGGDELFFGYPTFFAHRFARKYRKLPGFARGAIRRAAGLLPVNRDNFSFDFKVKRFVHGAEYPEELRHEVWLGSFDPPQQEALLTPEVLEATRDLDVYDAVRALHGRDGFRDDLDALCYEYSKLYLGAGVLTKVDRASMAVSLEARAPLLDREVVDYVTSLPSSFKLRGKVTKYLFKRALRGRLPDEILDRPKKGFGIPLGHWIYGPLREVFREVLAPEKVRAAGLFRPEVVKRLLDEHLAGKKDHRKLLWNLFMFEQWRAHYPS